MHYPFSYQLASWFCWEVSTTCYFSCTLVPLRASRRTFFPQHLLHCYNHRSYQWSDPHESEQACIVGPLLAQACRTLVLWLPRGSYPKEAMPPILILIRRTHGRHHHSAPCYGGYVRPGYSSNENINSTISKSEDDFSSLIFLLYIVLIPMSRTIFNFFKNNYEKEKSKW